MNEPNIVKGANFTCSHAGAKETWQNYHTERPNSPAPLRGKLFLKKILETGGLEMSLTVFPPGGGYPFLHRHRENEEVYVVLSGRGQFWVDGAFIDVTLGSIVAHGPAGGPDVPKRWPRAGKPPRHPDASGQPPRRRHGRWRARRGRAALDRLVDRCEFVSFFRG